MTCLADLGGKFAPGRISVTRTPPLYRRGGAPPPPCWAGRWGLNHPPAPALISNPDPHPRGCQQKTAKRLGAKGAINFSWIAVWLDPVGTVAVFVWCRLSPLTWRCCFFFTWPFLSVCVEVADPPSRMGSDCLVFQKNSSD